MSYRNDLINVVKKSSSLKNKVNEINNLSKNYNMELKVDYINFILSQNDNVDATVFNLIESSIYFH